MGRLLDHQGVIFKSGTIFSRDDFTKENRKNLDVLAGPNEKNTFIIDDTKRAWEENRRNLIQIQKYNYFIEGGHKLNKDDERDKDKALESISGILQGVHKMFFDFCPVPSPAELEEYVRSIDVSPVLEAFLKQV
ncbi:hypothetical protein MKW92_007719 [Papaver armeniacum]|nr:hypothetical protein MKW92_007719 [Papaver armeniacum]